MHGGARDKASKFWSYNPLRPAENMLESLGIRCDGNHTHKSWKPILHNGRITYPTKEEAAYPDILCERLASIFVHWARFRNLEGPKDLIQQVKFDADVGKRQLFTDQPRSTVLLQPVSEFGHCSLGGAFELQRCANLSDHLAQRVKAHIPCLAAGVFQGCALGYIWKESDHTQRSSSRPRS
jgi:hypothetical protein